VAAADRSVRIIDLENGNAVAGPVRGHAEAIAGLAFVADLGRLITVSRDSCIFVWRLPAAVVNPIRAIRCAATDSLVSTEVKGTDPAGACNRKFEYNASAAVAGANSEDSHPTSVPLLRRPTINDLVPCRESGSVAAMVSCADPKSALVALSITEVQESPTTDESPCNQKLQDPPQKPTLPAVDVGMHEKNAVLNDIPKMNADGAGSSGMAPYEMALKVSGLGDMEDDDESDEIEPLNLESDDRLGRRSAANQEDRDFQV
jgi:hypothetical protein